MKRFIVLLSVAVLACFVTGMVFAQGHRGAAGAKKARGDRAALTRAMGVVKDVNTADSTVTIAARTPGMGGKGGKAGMGGRAGMAGRGGRARDKGGKAGGTDLTVVVNADTKIFVGRGPGKLSDLAVGKRVMVAYKKQGPENVAMRIFEAAGAKGGAGKGGKGAGPAHAPAAKRKGGPVAA